MKWFIEIRQLRETMTNLPTYMLPIPCLLWGPTKFSQNPVGIHACAERERVSRWEKGGGGHEECPQFYHKCSVVFANLRSMFMNTNAKITKRATKTLKTIPSLGEYGYSLDIDLLNNVISYHKMKGPRLHIPLFRSIIVLYGTDIILHDILHIHSEYEKYSTKYCHSHITLLWIWMMLCTWVWIGVGDRDISRQCKRRRISFFLSFTSYWWLP